MATAEMAEQTANQRERAKNTASSAPTPAPATISVPRLAPTAVPRLAPTAVPSLAPTAVPPLAPTAVPSLAPIAVPPLAPTAVPPLASTASPPLTPTARNPSPTPTVYCTRTALEEDSASTARKWGQHRLCRISRPEAEVEERQRGPDFISQTFYIKPNRATVLASFAIDCDRLQ